MITPLTRVAFVYYGPDPSYKFLTPLKNCRRGQYMLRYDPLEMLQLSFTTAVG